MKSKATEISKGSSASSSKASNGHSATRPALSSRELARGQMLGGFYLAREIASGGMATLHLAHRMQHAHVGQVAAVKVIHSHLADDDQFVEMFLDEARIASSINHPNVCRVLDFGHAEGTYYLAMEHVMGETLAAALTRISTAPEIRKISAALVCYVVQQVCEGLHAAHEARDPQGTHLKVVHRDVSPQNIMIGYDGSVRVLDFGVASAAERLHSTRNGAIKGRLPYMAPEQMHGDPLDRRADLWSLGVVLWEGLAYRRLFQRPNEVQTIQAVMNEQIPSLADVAPSVPAPVRAVIERALQRPRNHRYATARDFGSDLSRAAASLGRFGMAELSAWMQALFADSIEEKHQMLREAAAAAEAARAESRGDRGAQQPEDEEDECDETRVAVPLPPRLRLAMAVDKQTPKAPAESTPPSVQIIDASDHANTRSSTFGRYARGSLAMLAAMFALAVPWPASEPGSRVSAHGSSASASPSDARAQPQHGPSTPGSVRAQQKTDPLDLAPAAAPPAMHAPQQASSAQRDRAAIIPNASSEPKSPAAKQTTEAPAVQPEAQSTSFGRRKFMGPLVDVAIVAPGGWADVYLGMRKLGTTPLRVKLPAGVSFLRALPLGKGPAVVRRIVLHGAEPVQVAFPIKSRIPVGAAR